LIAAVVYAVVAAGAAVAGTAVAGAAVGGAVVAGAAHATRNRLIISPRVMICQMRFILKSPPDILDAAWPKTPPGARMAVCMPNSSGCG